MKFTREIIEKTAEKIFIPMTVGGGIRTLKDIHRILRSGADKVSINTAAIKNPEFIKEATNYYININYEYLDGSCQATR